MLKLFANAIIILSVIIVAVVIINNVCLSCVANKEYQD